MRKVGPSDVQSFVKGWIEFAEVTEDLVVVLVVCRNIISRPPSNTNLVFRAHSKSLSVFGYLQEETEPGCWCGGRVLHEVNELVNLTSDALHRAAKDSVELPEISKCFGKVMG